MSATTEAAPAGDSAVVVAVELVDQVLAGIATQPGYHALERRGRQPGSPTPARWGGEGVGQDGDRGVVMPEMAHCAQVHVGARCPGHCWLGVRVHPVVECEALDSWVSNEEGEMPMHRVRAAATHVAT